MVLEVTPPEPQGTRLASKVAIVTGGGGGFGAAIAERFVNEGCRVLVGDLNEQTAKATVDKLGEGKAHAMKMDVSKQDDWKAAVKSCVDNYGRLDCVINNAGTTYKNKPTLEVTEAEFQRCFDVNVKSIYWSVAIAIPQMQKQGSEGGCIINIASIGSLRPRPGLVWYNSSKGAVSNVSRPHAQLRITIGQADQVNRQQKASQPNLGLPRSE